MSSVEQSNLNAKGEEGEGFDEYQRFFLEVLTVMATGHLVAELSVESNRDRNAG